MGALTLIRMSIVVSLVAASMGGVCSRTYGRHPGNAHQRHPIGWPERRRICAALCVAGLAGSACPVCQLKDVAQPGDGDGDAEICPLLCENQLGRPKCSCQEHHETRHFQHPLTMFSTICESFCTVEHKQLDGCPVCTKRSSGTTTGVVQNEETDWDDWCRDKCAVGDGGAACECDILPMAASIIA